MISYNTPYYLWWIAPAGALMLIGSIAMGTEQIYDATMERPSRLRKEQMMKGISGSWDKAEKKGMRSLPGGRRSKERGTFRPLRYDELIPKKEPPKMSSRRASRYQKESKGRFKLGRKR
jgi:hypothetical protein